jgi:hypothetical protein
VKSSKSSYITDTLCVNVANIVKFAGKNSLQNRRSFEKQRTVFVKIYLTSHVPVPLYRVPYSTNIAQNVIVTVSVHKNKLAFFFSFRLVFTVNDEK